MANITLTTIESNLVVDATNNIIQVNSTPTTIVVAEGGGLDIAGVRQAISNVAPILYNNTTGVISLDAEAVFSNTIANAWLATKTTTDLAEGTNLYFTAARSRGNVSATSATGITYNSGTGVFSLASIPNSSLTNTTVTINGKSVALGSSNTLTTTDIGEGTNLYFTAARARGNVSATDAGGMGAFSYSSGTGVFTYTGPSDSEVRAVISAANTTTGHGNISYSSSTGVITYDRVTPANILSEITAGNVKLKQYSETVFNAGNQSGSVTLNVANGSIQQLTLVGNITALNFTNITAGSTVSLILRQDAIGFRRLITTGWTNWDFVGDNTTLTVDPLAYDILTVTYDGTNYFASLVNFNTPVIQNSQLANSNVVVNGVTIALGSSGNIDTFYSNVTVNGNLNVTGNLNYQNVNDLYVTDQKITLNANATTNSNVEIISNRPTATNTMLKWNEQSTRWEFTNDGTTYYAIATSTTDLAEGSNLWFTTARANSAIDNRIVGGTGISYTAGTVALDFSEFNTGNITEGTNLYYTTARANTAIDDYVLGSENIDVTTGVISLTNALGNVNSITSSNSTNLTLNSDEKLVVTQNFKGREVAPSGNVEHDGYGFFQANTPFTAVTSYTGNANIQNFLFEFGNTTEGSNAITGVSVVDFNENPADLADVAVNSVLTVNENNPYPFPYGTYVTSVDAANSTVYMSQPAVATQNLELGTLAFFLQPALLDTTTGMAIAVYSEFDATGSGSKTTLDSSRPLFTGRYGYPQSGFAISDFDVITSGVAGDYTLGDSSPFMLGRNKLAAPKTVLQAPQGLIVGNNADLTNRAENDGIPSFGVNVLWDGTDTSYLNVPPTQILVKNYTDNNLQGAGALQRASFGPRLFFTASEGNALEPFTVTYPKQNLELGRISWWSPISTDAGGGSAQTGTGAPSLWISGVTGQDHITQNSGVGMYFGTKPNVVNNTSGLWLTNTKANTLIAGGLTGNNKANITFAPIDTSITSGAGNSPAHYEYAAQVGKQYGRFGYANMTNQTGSQLTVTNGGALGAGVTGDMNLTLHRSNNTGNVILTSLIGTNYLGSQNPDRVRFPGLLTLPAGTPVTINGFTNSTVAGALNGNVFYVNPIVASGVQNYRLYYDSGLTSPVNLAVGNLDAGPGTFEFSLASAGITDKRWDISLEEQSADLKFKSDGTTVATITDAGNINLATNATINYDAVYGCFHNMANVTAAAADTVYAFAWPNVHINTNRVTVAGNSQITIGQEGAYNFALEMQTENTDNQDRTAFIWLAKNGTDIDETCVRVSLLKKWKQVIVKEWIVDGLAANDYIEVRFAVDNTSGIQLTSIPAQASPYARPAVPAAVITVTPVGA